MDMGGYGCTSLPIDFASDYMDVSCIHPPSHYITNMTRS